VIRHQPAPIVIAAAAAGVYFFSELSSCMHLGCLADRTCNSGSFNFLHFLDNTQKPFFTDFAAPS
jgi:hypothetical protein